MIAAAARKKDKPAPQPEKQVYLKTGNSPHKAVPSWNYRMLRM
jgi:hypothetical protein